jgi:hypothetical protein
MRHSTGEQRTDRSGTRPGKDYTAFRNSNPPPGALVDRRARGSIEHRAGDQRKDRDGPVTADVIDRKPEHDRRPAVDQSAEHLFRFLRIDASIAHHRDARALRRQVALRGTVGNEARQSQITGIPRPTYVEIHDERGPGCGAERQRRDGTEYLVLRRPDGERRHL